nr:hypothetical protein CFP56_58776 [Quercus suber]
MPLPNKAGLVEGGCNCGAVRYKVQIPAKDERPIYPLGGADQKPPIHMPFVVTDHCNDCRRATGSLLPFWLLCPMHMVSISLVQKSSVSKSGRLDPSIISQDPWRPALDVFLADGPAEDTFLAFFASSPNRRRGFCCRCGTMITYCANPTPDWVDFPMVDFALGTVDRHILDENFMRPECQLHCDKGIGWVRRIALGGLKVPSFPTAFTTKTIDS